MPTTQSSAAYWEGWLVATRARSVGATGQPICPYKEGGQDRLDWALGFSDGVTTLTSAKSWYTSRTLICGAALVVIGLYLILKAGMSGAGPMSASPTAGLGAGLTAGGCIMEAFRMITKQPIGLGAE